MLFTELGAAFSRDARPPIRPLPGRHDRSKGVAATREKGDHMVTALSTQWDLRSAPAQPSRMNRVLAQALGQRTGAALDSDPAWAPALDVAERTDAYLVAVELPGSTSTTLSSRSRTAC